MQVSNQIPFGTTVCKCKCKTVVLWGNILHLEVEGIPSIYVCVVETKYSELTVEVDLFSTPIRVNDIFRVNAVCRGLLL